MTQIIIQTVTPILYLTAFVPVFLLTVFSLALVDNTIGFQLGLNGAFEALIAVIIFGWAIFWPINKAIVRLENITVFSLTAHLRYSAAFYILLLCLVFNFVTKGLGGSLLEAYLVLIAGISFWAILFNLAYLFFRFKRHKTLL